MSRLWSGDKAPAAPCLARGLRGRRGTPRGGVMQVTKHRAWTGVLVPAVTPLWVSPCPRHPRPFPRAHPAPIPAPALPPPPPGNESQMWPRCGRGGSSRPPMSGATCSTRCTLGRVTAKCGGCGCGPPCAPPGSGWGCSGLHIAPRVLNQPGSPRDAAGEEEEELGATVPLLQA